MRVIVSINPFDNKVHLSIVDLQVTKEDLYAIAQIAEETVEANVKAFLKLEDVKNRMEGDNK